MFEMLASGLGSLGGGIGNTATQGGLMGGGLEGLGQLNPTQMILGAAKGAVAGNPGAGQMVNIGNGYMAYAPNARAHRLASVLMGAGEGALDSAMNQGEKNSEDARQSKARAEEADLKLQNQMALEKQRFDFAQALNGGQGVVTSSGQGSLALPQGGVPQIDMAQWGAAGLSALDGIPNKTTATPLPAAVITESPNKTGRGIWNGYTPTQQAIRMGGMF